MDIKGFGQMLEAKEKLDERARKLMEDKQEFNQGVLFALMRDAPEMLTINWGRMSSMVRRQKL